jgi:hypothetical protein
LNDFLRDHHGIHVLIDNSERVNEFESESLDGS